MVVVSTIASAEDYYDFGARITHVYANDTGVLLIRIDVPHDSPSGYLQIDGQLTDPTVKAIYANALLALSANKTCWIRVYPRAGYWKVGIIQVEN